MRATSVSIRRLKLSKQKRDQIVLDHLPLVKAIAIRVHESLPVHVDLDDLIHAGVLGLFDAVIKYDASKNRSEEHTSELQSHVNLVCRLLLEKKNKKNLNQYTQY